MQGNTEQHQLTLISQLCGSITADVSPPIRVYLCILTCGVVYVDAMLIAMLIRAGRFGGIIELRLFRPILQLVCHFSF